jgi:hypothetical protein
VHGGPSESLKAVSDIVEMKPEVVTELLWARPKPVKEKGYGADDIRRLLKTLGGATLLLGGHTPLSYLPKEWIRNGVGVVADLQIILAASYGSRGGRKSFLELDLAGTYRSCGALAEGREIKRL